MTLTTSMLIGLVVVLIVSAIVAAIVGMTFLLNDHPVILGIIGFLFFWAYATFCVYLKFR